MDDDFGRSALLQRALLDAGHEVVALLASGDNLSARVEQSSPDVIIVDLASPDRDILEHMRCISRDNPKPVVMFAEDSGDESIRQAIQAGVSAYVVDGLGQERLLSVMSVAIARFREYQAMRDELQKARDTLEERKIIDRAKGRIMQKVGCSEEVAYQRLRKSAMDSNRRLVDVARQLLQSLELLD